MAARLIDGKAIAQLVRTEVARDVAAWVAEGHEPPGLATVLVGDDPASAVYISGKQKASSEVGIAGFGHRLPQDAAHEEVDALLRELAADPPRSQDAAHEEAAALPGELAPHPRVSGILLQLPTPPQVDGPALAALIPPG